MDTRRNEAQHTNWNSQSGPNWVALQPRYDAQLGPLGTRAMDALGDLAGRHVLDLGCGCGATVLDLATRARYVTGIDLSAPMLARAAERVREARLGNVALIEGDAQVHAFGDVRFDAVFSRFGVMFFDDPASAFARVRGVMVPGAPLAFVCWQSLADNDWFRAPLDAVRDVLPLPAPSPPDSPGPFAFADPARIRRVLGTAGFTHVAIDPVACDLLVGGTHDLDEATDFSLHTGPLGAALRELGASHERVSETVRARVRERFARHVRAGDGGVWMGARVWIVRATA